MTTRPDRQRPAVAGSGDVDGLACTLTATDQSAQVTRWRALLGAVVAREAIPGGVRLSFDLARVDVGNLATLAQAEAICCPFFDLSVQLGPMPTLQVRAPAEAAALVTELFGVPGR